MRFYSDKINLSSPVSWCTQLIKIRLVLKRHIIQESECFIEAGANSILLIYVDASESMYGSVAFAYNPGGEDGLICRPVDNPDLLPAWDLLN